MQSSVDRPSEAASVLVVEDEAIVALDLKMQLEAMGYRVVGIADTAADAVELGLRHQPDLTLMDVMLKGSADGIDAAEALKRSADLPVIFLTSFSDPETVKRAARTAAYGYLTKPFQIKELRAGMEVALAKSRLERQLRDSERWFAATLRCVQDGVIVADAEGRVRFLNAAAEQLTGIVFERAAGRPVHELVRYDDGLGEVAIIEAQRRSRVVGVRHGRMLVTLSGETRAVDESAGPVHDDRGRPLGAVLLLRDAGERLHQEALLRASEDRWRRSFEFAPLGMALVAMNGRFLQVNEALCRLLRCDPRWLQAQSRASVTHADDRAHEESRLQQLLLGRVSVVQFEKRFLAADREPVWALVSVSLLAGDDQPACHLYQIHDLTAQKAAATQLAELASERIRREASEIASQAKTEFISRVSHEMRTPLNAVLGFAQLLKMRPAGAEANVGAYSEHILNAGKHLLALVDDVLDLQRASEGRLKLVIGNIALAPAIEAAMLLLQPAADTRGIRLSIDVPPGLGVRADDTRLRQVLINLGSNAVKYGAASGSVVFAAAALPGERVRIGVRDDGIGMNAEQLDHLYEPFNRLGREATSIPGVGLGLVITRKLVEQMEGTLRITSAPLAGTEVIVELPLAKAH